MYQDIKLGWNASQHYVDQCEKDLKDISITEVLPFIQVQCLTIVRIEPGRPLHLDASTDTRNPKFQRQSGSPQGNVPRAQAYLFDASQSDCTLAEGAAMPAGCCGTPVGTDMKREPTGTDSAEYL